MPSKDFLKLILVWSGMQSRSSDIYMEISLIIVYMLQENSRVLVEYRNSLIINPSLGSISGNPTLWGV